MICCGFTAGYWHSPGALSLSGESSAFGLWLLPSCPKVGSSSSWGTQRSGSRTDITWLLFFSGCASCLLLNLRVCLFVFLLFFFKSDQGHDAQALPPPPPPLSPLSLSQSVSQFLQIHTYICILEDCDITKTTRRKWNMHDVHELDVDFPHSLSVPLPVTWTQRPRHNTRSFPRDIYDGEWWRTSNKGVTMSF